MLLFNRLTIVSFIPIMAAFHTLIVTDIRKSTQDCVLVTLAVPEEARSSFVYMQGQYLTLKTLIDGESVQRSYSLCSSPLDHELQVGIKKVPFGKFSTYANETLKIGDTLESLPPNGKFFVEVNKEAQKNYVCFAAGSGITPMLSIIKTHLTAEPRSTFKLFYINQTVSSIILKEELEALKNQHMQRFEIFHFLTRQNRSVELFNGRLDEGKLEVIFETICDAGNIDDYFICGPEAMIFLVKDFLESIKVDTKKIHFELFATTGSAPKMAPELKKQLEGKTTKVTLIEGGKSMDFEVAMGGDNILDAALNNSADLPYACKGGVCCTCRAKLIEGEVTMAVSYGLEEEEIKAGYVLTCQAMPTTERVVVDFDA